MRNISSQCGILQYKPSTREGHRKFEANLGIATPFLKSQKHTREFEYKMSHTLTCLKVQILPPSSPSPRYSGGSGRRLQIQGLPGLGLGYQDLSQNIKMGTKNNCLRCVVLDSLPNIEEEEEKIILPQAHVLKGWSSTGDGVC